MEAVEIKKRALEVAKKLKVKTVNATTDGNIFKPAKDGKPSNACINHSRYLKTSILEYEFTDEELKAGATTGEPGSEKPYGKMTKAELLAKCAEKNITAPEKATNADLVALLEQADEA